jgi:hypothetical protein
MTQQINLLEPSLLPKRDWFNGKNIVVGVAAAVALLSAHWAFEAVSMKRVMALATPAPGAADPAAPLVSVDELDRELSEGQSRLTRGELLMQAVASLTDLPTDNAARMMWVVNALPETAWLSEVEFTGRRGVRIVGGALAANDLAGFSNRLGANPAFRDVPVQTFLLRAQGDDAQAQGQPMSPDGGVPVPHYGFIVSSVATQAQAVEGVAR